MHKINVTPRVLEILRPALTGAMGTVSREIKSGISTVYQSANKALYIVVRSEGNQLVVVAVAGSTLYQSRGEIINFARLNQFKSIRFHTKHPERLARALSGLPFKHIKTRKALFSRDELIYKLEL